MLQLVQRCLVAACIAWLSVLILAAFGVILVILPWLRAPDVSRAVIFPIFLVVFGKSAELAFLVGMPIGFALGARRLVRAAEALGSPVEKIAGSHWRLVLTVSCAMGAMLGVTGQAYVNYWSLVPGRMARSALASARERCLEDPGAPGARIPLLGATWICNKSQLPRLVGTLPGSRLRGSFSAGDVRVSDDLLTVELDDVRLGVRPTGQIPTLQLRTLHASVHGVRAVFRPARLSALPRAVLTVGTGFLLAGLAAQWIIANRWPRRRTAWALSGPAAVIASIALFLVDVSQTQGPYAYLWVPLAGLIALTATAYAASQRARSST